MLTRKQNELLNYINNHMEKYEVPPSFDEMRNALGLASKSGIHRLVSGLEGTWLYTKASQSCPRYRNFKTNSQLLNYGASGRDATNLVTLPLLGRIAAGTPIEALSDPTNQIELPASMVGSGEHFALEIVGDSMIGVGILDGDTVVIQRAETARHGEIVVALIDQQEAA